MASAAPAGLMPALFLGHGSPMNVIESNPWRDSWAQLGRTLPRPAGILVVSAHWETDGVSITAATRPGTIHDFYGFPQALFDVRYPAHGDPALARRIATLLARHAPRLDEQRGLDHGCWGVLHAMYPAADVPVLQLSLDAGRNWAAHYALARGLLPLRSERVLVLGSGNLVHNLRLWRRGDARPAEWAAQFDALVRHAIEQRDFALLTDPQRLGPHARLAIPSSEHYLPLLYALALWQPDEALRVFNSEVTSSLSMTSLLIGEPGSPQA